MLTVKCPHCSAGLKLRQAPASGKVKCPKCSQVVPVASKSAAPRKPAAARPAAATRSQAVDPDDEAFDFGRINYPGASGATAVSQFPTAGQPSDVYQGPIPGDPLDALEADGQPAEAGAPGPGAAGPGAARAKKGLSPLVLFGILGVLGVGLIGAVILGVVLSGSGGSGGSGESGSSENNLLAKLQASKPPGYQAVEHMGCVALLPQGEKYEQLRSVIGSSSTAVQSNASGSAFFFGAMEGGSRELDDEQMRKKASKQLGGDILGGTPTERNNYKGIKGKLDGSLFLPNMMVEIYHVESRFVILGCAPASFEADPTVQMSVDRALEQEEQDRFYDSFKVGPKPSGWLF